jgi:flagellar motility protein MotE (MotC chaperone)
MMSYIRDLRLIPIAVIACACLLALKAADLLLDGGSFIAGDDAPKIERTSVTRTTADVPGPSSSMLSWASQMFNFPDGSGTTTAPVVASLPADKSNLDITGSVPAETADKDKQAKADQTKPDPAKPPDTKPPGTVIVTEPGQPSGAERAILERLQERRQELDTRARELDIRESLIKAAEKRMEGQLAELKETEARITVATQQKDDAQAARFKGLVTMYETMKPRDAAKIFDRLDSGVLLDVASKIEPRKMADILAQMSPDSAQRLTVELASQAQEVKPGGDSNELPKIQGQPTQ